MFVIQYRKHHWKDRWYATPNRFETRAEAQAFFDKLPIKADYRIAEEYTVTRYKPVK